VGPGRERAAAGGRSRHAAEEVVTMPADSSSVEGSSGAKTDLVLEGGGVKGLGLLGAVTSLAAHGYTFPRIAGTSAGAIVGALVAACMARGAEISRLEKLMEDLDYISFRDETPLDRLHGPGKVAELLLSRGIYKGDYLVTWLSKQLEDLGVETFGDLRISEADDPGSALPDHQRYRLVVMASDISTGQLVRLPWDYRHYGLEAESMRVVDAVRASMSIPFFFHPSELKTSDGNRVTLVDGGMLSNFPIESFDRDDGNPPRWPTFGVKLSARPQGYAEKQPTGNVLEFSVACLHTLLAAHDAYHLDDKHVTERTIFVDTSGVSATDFDIDRETQRRLFANGQQSAEQFLSTWPPPSFTAAGQWLD
jgi:NTE family protein